MPSTPFRSMTLDERAAWEATVRQTFPHIQLRWIDDAGPPGGDDTYDNIYWAIRHNTDPSIGNGYVDWWSQATGYWFEMSQDNRYHTLDAALFVDTVKTLLLSDPSMLWPYGDSFGDDTPPWPAVADGAADLRAASRVPAPVFKMPPPPGVGALHVRGQRPARPLPER